MPKKVKKKRSPTCPCISLDGEAGIVVITTGNVKKKRPPRFQIDEGFTVYEVVPSTEQEMYVRYTNGTDQQQLEHLAREMQEKLPEGLEAEFVTQSPVGPALYLKALEPARIRWVGVAEQVRPQTGQYGLREA